ncbi:MAG: bifunctional heptose 7-phosphate kinase/heptose 1-phosphate adenyltransferase [Candidatus Hydrogenedentes bacterium]|nr:bifunctional heptose 7-phosphate kinase/heptose 1-phosphate adenyltransferase [Candidatus Hydrogenedentota bacterium]
MNEQHYRDLLGRFEKARVLVVGDIYLDENVFGVMTGISLEAPIPIFEVQERRHNPGAAGNAACNVAALGAKTYMIGVVGADSNADIVRKEFSIRNVDTSSIVVDPNRPTNTYGKLRAGSFNAPSQEVLRTDTPKPRFISGAVEDQVIANIQARAKEVDAIVVVDQVSAVATERVLREVVACAKKHKLLTVGDSRERAGAMKDFDIIVPNDREAGIGAGVDVVDVPSLHKAGKALLKICKNALITRGPHGITIFDQNGGITDVPITPRDVVDVTGAGDTVTATVAVTMVAGGSLLDAASLGNYTAGIAVMKRGVVTVPKAELENELFSAHQAGPAKVRTLDELKPIVEALKKDGKTVVWTNGCFDILHAGHITYLQRAAKEGHVLLVGLNSDASVRSVKGPARPIIPEADRALVLSALQCVGYVIIFGETNTVGILKALQPDVYAKGGDYTIDTIVQEERKVVESYGGRIAIIPGVEGQSTSNIISKITQ